MDISSKLTGEQVQHYLRANRRNAASLLAAYRTTGDPALLEEAMQAFNANVSLRRILDLTSTATLKWLNVREDEL